MITSIKKGCLKAKNSFFLLTLVSLLTSFSCLCSEAQDVRKYKTLQAFLKQVTYPSKQEEKYIDLTLGEEGISGITLENIVGNLNTKEGIDYIVNTKSPALEFIIFVNEGDIMPIVLSGKPEKTSDSVLRVKYLGKLDKEQQQNLQKLAKALVSQKDIIGTLVVKGSVLCADAVLNPTSFYAQKGMEINRNPNPKTGWDSWKVTFKDITSISVIDQDGTQIAQDMENYSKFWIVCPEKFKSSNASIDFTNKKTGQVIQLSPVLSNPVFDIANKTITFDAYFMDTYDEVTNKTTPPQYPEGLEKTGRFSLETPLGFMLLRIVTTSLNDPEFQKRSREIMPK